MGKAQAPKNLGVRASAFWRRVVDKYELRADELRVLEDACREMRLIDEMEEALRESSLMIQGSMGQPVMHPLVAEIRQHRNVLASLLRSLKLPDEEGEEEAAPSRSVQARKAAQSKWATAHGKAS